MRASLPTQLPLRLAIALALAAWVLTISGAPAAVLANCSPEGSWGTNRPDLASQVVELVNQHRATKGLGALSVSSPLQASSTWKSLHLAHYGYFAHDDPAPPVARSASTRAGDCGYSGSRWGENIAYGYSSPQAVMGGWLGSSGHRANIENGSFTTIGVGVATNGGGTLYWTQNFGDDAASSPTPPPPPASPPPPPASPAPPPPPASPTPPPATPTPPPPGATPPREAGAVGALGVKAGAPRVGRRFDAAVAFVWLDSGKRLTAGDVRCYADISGKRMRVVVNTYRDGMARCAWRVPAGAAGKKLTGVIALQLGSTAALRRFARTVTRPS